jgi:lysophospholipase L1-like esterase
MPGKSIPGQIGRRRRLFLTLCLTALAIGSVNAWAQQGASSPPVTQEPAQAPAQPPTQTPAQAPAAAPPAVPTAAPDPMRTDWPNLKRYRGEDSALAEPAPGEKRVVFMGDSITQAWVHHGVPPEPTVPGKSYVNRGISGQTTPQMLLRFRQDVIHLRPSVVVILAGINDIAGNTGDMTPEQTEDNLESMADLAKSNGIRVVMCSILPAFDFPWRPGKEPAPKVIALNQWIKAYAESHGHVYVDFYSAMVDARGGLPEKLSKDGVHPTPAGYAIMTPLVDEGIAKALAEN